MVAEGAIGQLLAGGDRALQHHLAMAGHLQVHGFALGQPHALSGIEAGEQPFAQLHRDRGGRRHHQQRMHADRDRDLQLLAHGRRLAQVAGAAAHAQPVHGHGVDRLLLQPVHAHVGGAGFRVLGDHQAERDDPAGIARPGAQQRQGIEIHLLPLEHLLVAGGREVQIRPRLEHIQQHRTKAHRFPCPLRRAWLLQQRQPLAKGLELLGPLHTHAPEHPFLGPKQVDRHRHGGADHVLEQQRRPAAAEHPISDRRQLQIRIHRRLDPAQLAALLEKVEKTAQVSAAARAQGCGGARHRRGPAPARVAIIPMSHRHCEPLGPLLPLGPLKTPANPPVPPA